MTGGESSTQWKYSIHWWNRGVVFWRHVQRAKNTRGHRRNLKRNGTNTKNTKILSAFLDALENTKTVRKYKVYFLVFLGILLYFYILPKKYACKISRVQNKKNVNPNLENTKYNTSIKRNRTKKQIQRKKNGPIPFPYSFWKKLTSTCKINAKATCCIFYTLQFWFCIWVCFFVFKSGQKTLL